MTERPEHTAAPLLDGYDALFVDLDGVVQLDNQAVPGAADALGAARGKGLRLVFLTNNAARTPADVADRLAQLGVPAEPGEVVSSPLAAVRLLTERFPPGAPVFVVGAEGLRQAVADAGFEPVGDAAREPVAVVQGWGPEIDWHLLAEACVALRGGAWWVATNLDRTLPSPRGPLPGNGSLIAALRTATGRDPDRAAGKPEPAMFHAAVESSGARRPLVVGDRLDTDIAGATNAGLPSLVVLTGVSQPRDLLSARAGERPTYVGADLRALARAAPDVEVTESEAHCGDVTVTVTGDVTRADGRSAPHTDGLDGLRAACALAWSGRLPESRWDDCLHRLGLA